MESILFIGRIHSPLRSKDDCPLQEAEGAPEAEIEIYPEYSIGIKDIVPGSKLIVLTWLHTSDRSTLVTQPRNNPQAEWTGVFSTRSPDRPNPIGLHTVVAVTISETGRIKVNALEVLDQTPVIDIKPVLDR